MTFRDFLPVIQQMDPTLNGQHRGVGAFDSRRVMPSRYSRRKLFSNMAAGHISLFQDFARRMEVAPALTDLPAAQLFDNVLKHGNRYRLHNARIRQNTQRHRFRLGEIEKRWHENRIPMCITDMHIRNSNIEDVVDTGALSSFNLLPWCKDDAALLEMMTLVISTEGGITQSHSDDADGSNHCFTGKKLWLAWDTQEGLRIGLEDTERGATSYPPDFDLTRFMALDSACWFVVEPGQTLFLPGNLTHKVYTLEPYLGVGSFYVALPNLLRSLSRWLLHEPNWVYNEDEALNRNLLPDLEHTLNRRIGALQRSSAAQKQQWGVDYIGLSMRRWQRDFSRVQRHHLKANPLFNRCFQRLERLAV